MHTPDMKLHELYREREKHARELYLADERINAHLWEYYSLKKVRAVYQGQPVLPGIDPQTIDDREVDFP